MEAEKLVLGYDKFLMMALLKEGSLSIKDLREKSILFISLIWYQQLPGKGQSIIEKLFFSFFELRSKLEDTRSSKAISSTEAEMDKLINKGWVKFDPRNKYELTGSGISEAKKLKETVMKEASWIERDLNPSSTAINTTYLDFFLAWLKLSAGFISGSVGLIADGTDATMDTVSAFLVWLGIKHHRENLSTILVIFGLFIASLTVGLDSISHILRALNGTLEPLTHPYLVISVEGIAMLAAFFLFYYQRYVGKFARSLTLISQSVDSKNHIFIGFSVITGAIFALYGIYYVDAIIGLFIAAGIFIDALSLLQEVITTQKGINEDYSQYKLPLQVCWEENNFMAFRNWILYVLWAENINDRLGIVKSLQRVFNPENYIPVLSELKATCSETYDFEGRFEILIKPLKEYGLIIKENANYYSITENGVEHMHNFINHFKYYDVHLSDTILLAMARDEAKI